MYLLNYLKTEDSVYYSLSFFSLNKLISFDNFILYLIYFYLIYFFNTFLIYNFMIFKLIYESYFCTLWVKP